MSLKINISIEDDDSLIEASKERAIANQQALVERQDRKEIAEQAEQEVERELERTGEDEDPRNGIPDTSVPRRPAAQRRRKEDYDLVFLDDYNVRVVLNSNQTITAEPWPYVRRNLRVGVPDRISCPPDAFNPDGYTLSNQISERITSFTQGAVDNSYSEYSSKFFPSLNFNGTTYTLPSKLQSQTNDQITRWLTRIDNFITEYTASCGSPFRTTTFSGFVISEGPTFPRSHVFPRPVSTRVSLTSTPRYIYITALIRQRRYNLSRDVQGSYNPPASSGFDPLNTTRVVVARDFESYEYGYYARFDTLTRTVESRIELLQERFSTSLSTFIPASPDRQFVPSDVRQLLVQNMYTDDPRKLLSANQAAVDPDISTFGYDPSTGAVYFHGLLNASTEDLKPYLYGGKVNQNTEYQEVYSLLKAAKIELASRTEAPTSFVIGPPSTTFTLKQTLLAREPGAFPTIIGVVPTLRR